MMYRSHVALGSAITVAGAATAGLVIDPSWGLPALIDTSGLPLGVGLSAAGQRVVEWFIPWSLTQMMGLLWMAVSLGLLWLGFGLPDVDSSTSRLGRHVPTPGPHRGLLHSDWPVYALVVLSVWEPLRPLLWLALGYWTHLELDGFSRAGRARWYPLGSGWRETTFHGERMIVRTGWRGLYRANQRSERWFYVAVVIGCLVPVAALVLAWYHQGPPSWSP